VIQSNRKGTPGVVIFCVALIWYGASAPAQVDRSALTGPWLLVGQEQEDNLHEPTSYDDRYKGKTIEEAILIKKKEYLGKVRMDFQSSGKCLLTQYGNERTVDYAWDKKGLLQIGTRNYFVRNLDTEEMVLEDRGSSLFNLSYYYIPAADYDAADETSLLAFTHYDSLVIKMAKDRDAIQARKDLYRNPHHRPEYEGGWEAFEKHLEEEFGDRFIPRAGGYKGKVQISKLTFVVEPDGEVKHVGSEVSQTDVYEYFQDFFEEHGDQWTPGVYKGRNVPCLVEYVMRLKDD
jgi:hypothetical protein